MRLAQVMLCGYAGAGQNSQGAISLADVFTLRDGKASPYTTFFSQGGTLLALHIHT